MGCYGYGSGVMVGDEGVMIGDGGVMIGGGGWGAGELYWRLQSSTVELRGADGAERVRVPRACSEWYFLQGGQRLVFTRFWGTAVPQTF